MEAERRRRSRVRKPLSDCTNTIAAAASSQSSSSSSLCLKPQKPLFSSAIKKLLPNTQTKSTNSTTTTSTAQNDDASQHVSPLPAPVASTPLRPPRSPSASGRGDSEAFEACSVYGRRQTAEKNKGKMKEAEEPLIDTIIAEKRKSKGKAIVEPLSCPPATKIQRIGAKMKEDGGYILSKASTAPSKKKQGLPPSRKDAAKHALSKEFIEQQRAYFAEIDAFELPEEEVDSGAELD
ncbi:hypothetical protein PanWU01x14_015510 [Parasponia andersonii]|uniref:Sororin C-terminal region domain-containing protein n=1 Tax=Parasponia andersonii TaxID=3476 RepID=A0A2P5E0H7_PARAD|nr:hypothetical protein PanWU01x14_015510 [Parasponia andersonii]